MRAIGKPLVKALGKALGKAVVWFSWRRWL